MIRFLCINVVGCSVYIFPGSSSLMCFTFYISSLVTHHSSFFIHHFTLHSSFVISSFVYYTSSLITHHLITHHSSLVTRHLVVCLLHLVTRRSSFISSLVARCASFFISSFVYHTSSLVTSSLHSSLVTLQWRATPPQKAIKERQRSQLHIYLVLWTPPRPARWAIH